MSAGFDTLNPQSLGATDGGVAVVATGTTGGYLHALTPYKNPAVVDGDAQYTPYYDEDGVLSAPPGFSFFGPPVGTGLVQDEGGPGRAVGSIIVPNASETIGFARTIITTSPVSDGSLIEDGIVISDGAQLYVSTLIVHVGNETSR